MPRLSVSLWGLNQKAYHHLVSQWGLVQTPRFLSVFVGVGLNASSSLRVSVGSGPDTMLLSAPEGVGIDTLPYQKPLVNSTAAALPGDSMAAAQPEIYRPPVVGPMPPTVKGPRAAASPEGPMAVVLLMGSTLSVPLEVSSPRLGSSPRPGFLPNSGSLRGLDLPQPQGLHAAQGLHIAQGLPSRLRFL